MITQSTQPAADAINLHLLYRSLFENKWRIIIMGFITLFITLAYIVLLPTEYKAHVILQIHHKTLNSLGALTNATNQINEEESLPMQMAFIRSSLVLGPVVDNLALDIETSSYKNSWLPFLLKDHAIHNKATIRTLQVPMSYLQKPFYLKLIDSHHLQLFDEGNRLLLSGAVGQLLKNDQGFALQVDKVLSPHETTIVLKKYSEIAIINHIRSKLVVTELSNPSHLNKNIGLLQLSFAHPDPKMVVKILNQIAIVAEQKDSELKALAANNTLQFLMQQLPIIKSSLREAEAKLNHYRAISGKIDIKLQTQYLFNHLANVDKQLEEIRIKRANLLQQNTSFHPFIRSLTKEYQELNKKRRQILSQIKRLPAADQVALNLARDVEVKSQLYMTLLNKIHFYQVIKNGIVSDISILSLAQKPEMPLPKRLPLIGLVSLCMGLLLGGLVNLCWKILNRRIDDPEWTEHNLQIAHLITLPYIQEQTVNSKAYLRFKNNRLPLLSIDAKNDATLESFRMLRTILQNKLATAEQKIITFTSLSHDVGKTFITANLAALLALTEQKVLLIDGNIRFGELRNYFPGAPAQGLTDILIGQADLGDAVFKTTVPHLFFLASGYFVKNSADLLITDRFKDLLKNMAKSYKYVLIDSPKLSITDSVIIAKYAQLNLLVMGANKHKAKEVAQTLKLAHHTGIMIHGTLFNHLKPQNMSGSAFDFAYEVY